MVLEIGLALLLCANIEPVEYLVTLTLTLTLALPLKVVLYIDLLDRGGHSIVYTLSMLRIDIDSHYKYILGGHNSTLMQA